MALALEGASIPSSNTDGIYVFNMEIEKNKKIVDNELKNLYVQIDPEPVYLVSKDSNNRMELEDGKVVSARGGSLTSWQGARVDNRLSHPAIIDRVMTTYLQNPNVLNGPVNMELIKQAFTEYRENPDIIEDFEDYKDAKKRSFIYMASWVMRSTSGSIMTDENDNIYPGTVRTWLTKEGSELKQYATRKIKPSKTLDEYADQLFPDTRLGEPETIQYLTSIGAYEKHLTNAITIQDYREVRDLGETVYVIGESKITNLPENAKVYMNNNSLFTMSEEEIDNIYNKLSIDDYISMMAETAEKWHNKVLAS